MPVAIPASRQSPRSCSPNLTSGSSTSSYRIWNQKVSWLNNPSPASIKTKLLTVTTEVLRWAITTLPGLFQTTAFGLTGLVTLDMLSKMTAKRSQKVDLIFLDTLHHFAETHDLIARVRKQYPDTNLHIYAPDGASTPEEFTAKYGEKLWETNDTLYDWVAKVEPAQRAYSELDVRAVLTGRRRSQGGKRGDLDIIEVDEAGLVKVNPLANWSFKQVQDYVRENGVPYNTLLDQGYKSVGDWHSTQ